MAQKFYYARMILSSIIFRFFENIFPAQIPIETLQLLKRFKRICLNNHSPEVGAKIIHPPN